MKAEIVMVIACCFLTMAILGSANSVVMSQVSQTHGQGFTELTLKGEGMWTLIDGNESNSELIHNVTMNLILYNQTMKGRVDYALTIDVTGMDMKVKPIDWNSI